MRSLSPPAGTLGSVNQTLQRGEARNVPSFFTLPLADSGQRAPCRSGPPLPGQGTCEVSRCHRSLRGGWSCGRGGRFWGDVGCILEEPRLHWVCWHNELCSLLHCFIMVCWLAAIKLPDLTGEIIRSPKTPPKCISVSGQRVPAAPLRPRAEPHSAERGGIGNG